MARTLPPYLCGAIYGIPFGVAWALDHATSGQMLWTVLHGIGGSLIGFSVAKSAAGGAKGEL
jgi:hypothetical protein